jgi:hypothetical protein
MGLTGPQLATLKADIAADPTLNAIPKTPDGNQQIANAYNLNASPAFTVWKTNVGITEIGDKFNGVELANLSQLNIARLQCMAQHAPGGVNPSLTDRRQFYDEIFSGAGGNITRPALAILWRRLARRGERLYATGTGSDASPGMLVFEGLISHTDVQQARDLP